VSIGVFAHGLEVRVDATAVELPAGGTFTHTFPMPNAAALLDNLAPNGFAGMTNAVHAVLGT
jgi:hypothetical protein